MDRCLILIPQDTYRSRAVIAQSSESEASKSVLRSIFLSKKYDSVLRSLLFDSPNGPPFIGKILAPSTM